MAVSVDESLGAKKVGKYSVITGLITQIAYED